MEVITSVNNEKVINWAKLKQKKYRDETNLFLIEGEHLVLEALKCNIVKEVIIEENKLFPVNVPTHYVTSNVLKKLTDQVTPSDVFAVCFFKEEEPIGKRVLILDSLQDPGNLGTIIRSAVAFQIDTIILGENTVSEYNSKVMRSSEGMLFHINIIHRDLKELIPLLKKDEYLILGTNVKYGTPLKDIRLHSKFAFIIGNEGNGVDEELLDMCDKFIYIPMSEACESLNAGVAAGIILYELSNHYLG